MAEQSGNIFSTLLSMLLPKLNLESGPLAGIWQNFLSLFNMSSEEGKDLLGQLTGEEQSASQQQQEQDGDSNKHTNALEENTLSRLRTVANVLDETAKPQVEGLIAKIESGELDLGTTFTQSAREETPKLEGDQTRLTNTVNAAFQSNPDNLEKTAAKIAALAPQAEPMTPPGS